MVPPFVALAARPNPGFWEYVKVNSKDLTVDEITATDYLKLKESVFDESWLVKKNLTYCVLAITRAILIIWCNLF